MNRALTALHNERKELEHQIASLQARLNRVQAAITALTAGDLFDELNGLPSRRPRAPGTLKQMAFTVLYEAGKAMTANQILDGIGEKFRQKIDRTSLSPQLSRLGEARVLIRNENLWSINPQAKDTAQVFYLLKDEGDLL